MTDGGLQRVFALLPIDGLRVPLGLPDLGSAAGSLRPQDVRPSVGVLDPPDVRMVAPDQLEDKLLEPPGSMTAICRLKIASRSAAPPSILLSVGRVSNDGSLTARARQEQL